MVPLAKYSKYLRDPAELQRAVKRNVEASSRFEGASPCAFHKTDQAPESISPRRIASSKKDVNNS